MTIYLFCCLERYNLLIADLPTVQLSTKQSDEQAPTLLDGKSQLQQTKEKKSTLEPRVDPPSESDMEEKDTQLRASKQTENSLCCFGGLMIH